MSDLGSADPSRMTFSLKAFPVEVIGQILDQPGLSSGVLRLWMAGDSLLQRLIVKGVTVMDLRDFHHFSVNPAPMLLKRLSSLRELTIDRDRKPLIQSKDLWKLIGALSGLSKLVLRFKGSFSVIDRNVMQPLLGTLASSAETPIPSNWTIQSLFPALETLEVLGVSSLWEPQDFESLPSSLTSLTITEPCINTFELSSALPRQLKHLKIFSNNGLFPGLSSGLPPNLIVFEHYLSPPAASPFLFDSAYDRYAEMLQNLPRSLTRYDHNFRGIPISLLCHLPPGDLELIRPSSEAGAWWTLSSSQLRKLPQSLTKLSTSIYDDDEVIVLEEDWPARLTDLQMVKAGPNFDTPDFPAQCNFSSGLRRLEVTSMALSILDVARLPRELTSLRWTAKDFYDVPLELPPKLTHLSAKLPKFFVFTSKINLDQPENLFPISCIPSSVTELEIASIIPTSRLKILPPRLKELRFYGFGEDHTFDPLAEAERSRVRHNFEHGKLEGIVESFDVTPFLERASIETLLPRTLTAFHIDDENKSFRLVQKIDYRLFPPNITSLTLLPDNGIPSEVVINIPLKKLYEFEFRLDSPTDKDFKAFPTWIRHFLPQIKDTSRLTPIAALYVKDMLSLPGGGILDFALKLLADARMAAFSDTDRSQLLKLLSHDESILKLLNLV